MTREQLENALYVKASNEQNAYTEKLKASSPETVIQNAYELVMRDDILMTFEEPDYLSNKQIKALLKTDNILSNCYNEWLENDCSHMDMLRDTVSDFSSALAIRNEQERKAKKNNEPER